MILREKPLFDDEGAYLGDTSYRFAVDVALIGGPLGGQHVPFAGGDFPLNDFIIFTEVGAVHRFDYDYPMIEHLVGASVAGAVEIGLPRYARAAIRAAKTGARALIYQRTNDMMYQFRGWSEVA